MYAHFSVLFRLFTCLIMRHQLGYTLTAHQKLQVLDALYKLWVSFFSEYMIQDGKLGKTRMEVFALGDVCVPRKTKHVDQDEVHGVLQVSQTRSPLSHVSIGLRTRRQKSDDETHEKHRDPIAVAGGGSQQGQLQTREETLRVRGS